MHTRNNPKGELVPLNTELEKLVRENRRLKREEQAAQEEAEPIIPYFVFQMSDDEDNRQPLPPPPRRTIRELSTSLIAGGIPSCIRYPQPAEGKTGNFELRTGFLHKLPTFHGLPNEDPNLHLQEFQFICSSMTPENADENIMKMKAFPFSLADKAKTWLYRLPNGYITSWNVMHKTFLEKYFPTSKIIALRKQITGIQQGMDEAYSEYFERFQTLLTQCPQHGLSEDSLLTGFYDGLIPIERDILDAAAGGSFMDKYNEDGMKLIADRALNAQQFNNTSRRVQTFSSKGGNDSEIKAQLSNLTSMLSQVLGNKKQGAMACGVCSMEGHHTDRCPQLYEEEEVKVVGNFQQGRQHVKNDPYAYYPGLRNHPNFRWSNNDNVLGPFQASQSNNHPPPGFTQRPQGGFTQNSAPHPASSSSLTPILDKYDKMFEALTSSTQQLIQSQQNQGKEISDLKKQVGECVNKLNQLHDQGKLPSNTIPNPRGGFESAKVVTTRSGRVLSDVPKAQKKDKSVSDPSEIETELAIPDPATTRIEDSLQSPTKPETKGKIPNSSIPVPTNPLSSCLPFPSRFAHSKEEEDKGDVLDILRKVQVNIPLLDIIKQVPKYAKFLKDLCTKKRKFKGNEVVALSEEVSSILQQKLPPKLKDPGQFTIPCTIGVKRFDKALLDLGASINLMPFSVFSNLNLGTLKKTSVVIELADRSSIHPLGVIEDVLVRVDGLVLPADFFVIDMEETSSPTSLPLILGRPFMATAHTNINVYKGTLTMEVLGERVTFQVFEHNDITKGMVGREDKELREEVRFLRGWKGHKVKEKHSLKNLNKENKGNFNSDFHLPLAKCKSVLVDRAHLGNPTPQEVCAITDDPPDSTKHSYTKAMARLFDKASHGAFG
ncbi:uncharacterized protein LOC112184226 [Rosa chinensis]|uniref:uncharacterized protein LOC112184226 n=1 Tax=Rosa chinensis TaxID=74649 RepID=UPI000D088909|nr:uncharacterized protein LOC112184226 [Rosa chinensis]